MACLQNEVGTKYFFSRRENAPKLSPMFLSLYFMGPKKSRKIPAKFPAKFPSPPKKNSPASFCRVGPKGESTEEVSMKRSNFPNSRAFYTVVSFRFFSEVALIMDTPFVETRLVFADFAGVATLKNQNREAEGTNTDSKRANHPDPPKSSALLRN